MVANVPVKPYILQAMQQTLRHHADLPTHVARMLSVTHTATYRPGSVPCSPNSAARRQLRLADATSPASESACVRSGGQEGSSEPSEDAPGLPSSSESASASSFESATATSLRNAGVAAQPADAVGAAMPNTEEEDGGKILMAAVACVRIVATAGAPVEAIWGPPPSPDAAPPGSPLSASPRMTGSLPTSRVILAHPLASVAEHAQGATGGHTPLRSPDAPSAAHLQGDAVSASSDLLGLLGGSNGQPQSGSHALVRSVSLRETYGGSPAGHSAEQPAEAPPVQPRGPPHGTESSGVVQPGDALPPGFAALRTHGATGHRSCSEAIVHVPVHDDEDEADAAFSLVRTARVASGPRLSAVDEADDLVGASQSVLATRPCVLNIHAAHTGTDLLQRPYVSEHQTSTHSCHARRHA